jgi:CheY-like chemotaxis protein
LDAGEPAPRFSFRVRIRGEGAPVTTTNAIRVLLVEDEPDHALLFRKMLTSAVGSAIHVTHLSTVREASESLAADPPDVVLLDLMLPTARADTFGRLTGSRPSSHHRSRG